MKLWKSLVEGMKSSYGEERDWEVGVWREHTGDLVWCSAGFHASATPAEAMYWVFPAAYLAEVEVDGKDIRNREEGPDKSCHHRMRLLRVWETGEKFWEDAPQDIQTLATADAALTEARATYSEAAAAYDEADAALIEARVTYDKARATYDAPRANAWIMARLETREPTGAITDDYIDAAERCGIPKHMQEGLAGYLVNGLDVGGFLTFVLCNNLVEAACTADKENLAALHSYALFLHNEVPMKAWGSIEKVQAWKKARREEEEKDADGR